MNPDRPSLWKALRWVASAVCVGILIGGWASAWTPVVMAKSALLGLLYTVPTLLGLRLFRTWNYQGPLNAVAAGRFYALKLLALWALCMAVLLPGVHWGLGLPVLKSPSSALPHMTISLCWLSILLVAQVATELHETRTTLAQREAQAAFLTLKAQLQPHTLFNALNTIGALARTQPERSEEGTRRLAALLRGVMEGLDQPHWDLASECHLLEQLLGLESLRFGDRLTWRIELPPSEAHRTLPPLLLLPLVENALKHGFRPKVGPCHLHLTVTPEALVLEDDGVGLPQNRTEGVGLRSVRTRWEAQGGQLFLSDRHPGCRVEVRWP